MNDPEKNIFKYKLTRIELLYVLIFYSAIVYIFFFSGKDFWDSIFIQIIALIYVVVVSIEHFFVKKSTILIIDKTGITQSHRWLKHRNWHCDYADIVEMWVCNRKLYKVLHIETTQGDKYDIQYLNFKLDQEPKATNVQDLAILKAIAQYHQVDFPSADEVYAKQSKLLAVNLNQTLGRHVEILAYTAVALVVVILVLAFKAIIWIQLGGNVNLIVGIVSGLTTTVIISTFLKKKKARVEGIIIICTLYLFIGGFAGTLLLNFSLGMLGNEHSVEYEFVRVKKDKLTWQPIDKTYPSITYYISNILQRTIYDIGHRHVFRIKGGLFGMYVIDEAQLVNVKQGLMLDP
ncbi:hypothetical protein MNBD_GAMMA21-1118 [hydrothermal vent metagenome]|uniref:Uncharacterized protein n=1 Tax=hydrothermal vent metagenome TaxID=652676 RepID=A0A3B1ALW4_9ZZZZ